MNAYEFYRMVETDPDLSLVRCDETASGEAFVEVRYAPAGGGTRIPLREILSVDREQLLAVMKFRRPARIIKRFNQAGCAVEHPACIRMVAYVTRAA